jgi:hypothetical protein
MFKKGIKAIAEMGVSLLGPYLTECLQNSQGIYFGKQLHQYYKRHLGRKIFFSFCTNKKKEKNCEELFFGVAKYDIKNSYSFFMNFPRCINLKSSKD